jgi:hypothetical protein
MIPTPPLSARRSDPPWRRETHSDAELLPILGAEDIVQDDTDDHHRFAVLTDEEELGLALVVTVISGRVY